MIAIQKCAHYVDGPVTLCCCCEMQVQQYPSNEALKAKLRTKAEWAAYKASVINNYVHNRILVNKVNT